MKRILIVTNATKDVKHETTDKVIRLLQERDIAFEQSEDPTSEEMRTMVSTTRFQLAIVIGGDGSFIRTARFLVGRDIPILGINMGTLGYLTEVELTDIEEAIDQLSRHDYEIENRMMLEGTVNEAYQAVALNDIVVTRKGGLRVIYFDIFVNGELLNSYQADGIVVSTPTGSTAYNLSAGGPIVKPTASVILVTPICSHALYKSGIVLPPDDDVTIKIRKGKNNEREEVYVSFDGEDVQVMQTGDEIKIRRAAAQTRILKLDRVSFLDTLRRKMKGS